MYYNLVENQKSWSFATKSARIKLFKAFFQSLPPNIFQWFPWSNVCWIIESHWIYNYWTYIVCIYVCIYILNLKYSYSRPPKGSHFLRVTCGHTSAARGLTEMRQPGHWWFHQNDLQDLQFLRTWLRSCDVDIHIYIYLYLCINFKICLFDGDLIAWILRYGHGVRNVSDSDGFQIWDWGVTNPPNIVGIPVETDRLGNFFWTLIFLLVLSREWMGNGGMGWLLLVNTSDYGSFPHSLPSTSKFSRPHSRGFTLIFRRLGESPKYASLWAMIKKSVRGLTD